MITFQTRPSGVWEDRGVCEIGRGGDENNEFLVIYIIFTGVFLATGIRGEKIPLMARVLCIADCYDSMTADRPYRSAMDGRYAVEEIRKCSGTHFDPGLVEVFLKIFEKGFE